MSDSESESIEIGPPDIFGRAYVAYLNTDAGFYHLQDENTCNLCAPWLKRMPGSDERILAIEDDEKFRRAALAYRTPKDGLALSRERSRRKREERRRAWR